MDAVMKLVLKSDDNTDKTVDSEEADTAIDKPRSGYVWQSKPLPRGCDGLHHVVKEKCRAKECGCIEAFKIVSMLYLW